MIADKQLLLKNFIGEEEKLAFSKSLDQAIFAMKRHAPAFTDFMDPIKAEKVAAVLRTCRGFTLAFAIFGGNPSCERVRIGFFPDSMDANFDEFPIDALEVEFDARFSEPGHRDFLGALLGLGIDRGRIGDIFVKQGRAVIFVDREMSSFICGSLEKIGRYSATAKLLAPEDVFVYQIEKEETMITVSSLRLDSVLAAAFHLSRGKVAQLVAGEKALVNWNTITSVTKQIEEGDRLTLRGHGRIQVAEIVGKTKKDKIIVKILI